MVFEDDLLAMKGPWDHRGYSDFASLLRGEEESALTQGSSALLAPLPPKPEVVWDHRTGHRRWQVKTDATEKSSLEMCANSTASTSSGVDEGPNGHRGGPRVTIGGSSSSSSSFCASRPSTVSEGFSSSTARGSATLPKRDVARAMTPPPPLEQKLNISDLLSGIEMGPPGLSGLRPPPEPGEYAPRRMWAKPRPIKAAKVDHFVPDTTDETRREIAVKITRTCRALLGMIDLATSTTLAERASSMQDIFDSKLGIRGTAKQKMYEDMKLLQYSEREVLDHLLTREKLKAQTKKWKKLQNDCDLDLQTVDRRMQLQARHTNKILTNATGGAGTDELGGKLFHLQLKHREMAALAALGAHKVGHFHKFCQFKGQLAQRRVEASSALKSSGQLTTLKEEEDEDAIELPTRKRKTQYDEVMRLQLELEVATDEKRKRFQEKQHENQWQKEAERSAFQEEQATKSTEEKMLDHKARVEQALALPTDQSVNAERLVNFIHNGEASLKKQLSELAELHEALKSSEASLVEEIRDVCQREVTAMVESGDVSEELVLQVTQDPQTTQAVIKPLQHRRNRLVLMRDILVKDVGDLGVRFSQQVDEKISKLPISEIIANNWTKPMADDFQEKFLAATKVNPGGRAHGLTELLDTATSSMKKELLARQQKDFEAVLQVEAGAALGFDGEVHGSCTVVKAIAESGFIAAYNKANPEEPILPDDRIVSSSLASMLTPFGKGTVRRNLTLQQSAALEVTIERHGKDVLAEVEHQQMVRTAREARLQESAHERDSKEEPSPDLQLPRRRGTEPTSAAIDESRQSDEEEKEDAKARQREQVMEGIRLEEQLQAQARNAEAVAREAMARTNALRKQVGDLLAMCESLLDDLMSTHREMRKWSHKDDADALKASVDESKEVLKRLKGVLSQNTGEGVTQDAIAQLEALLKGLLDKVESAAKKPNFGQATLQMELNEEQANNLMSARVSMALSKSRQGSQKSRTSWPEHGEDLFLEEEPEDSDDDSSQDEDDNNQEVEEVEQVEDLRKQLEDMQNELGVNDEAEKVISEMLSTADQDEDEEEDPEVVAARKAAKFMSAFRMRMLTMMPRKLRKRGKPALASRPRAWKVGAKVIAPRRGNLSAAVVARELEDQRLLLDWVDGETIDREKHEGQIRSDFDKGEQVQALRDGIWHKATVAAQKARDHYEVDWKDGSEEGRVVPLADMWCAELEEFLAQALDKTQKELAFFKQRESDAKKGLKQVMDLKNSGTLVKTLNPMSRVVRGSTMLKKFGTGIISALSPPAASPPTPAAAAAAAAREGVLGPLSTDGNLDGLTVTPLQDNTQNELLAELEKAAGLTGVGAAALASPKDRHKAQVAAKKQIAEVQKLLQSRLKVLMATLPSEEAAKLKLQRRATFSSGKSNSAQTASTDSNTEEKQLADKLKQLNKLMGFWSRRIEAAKEAQVVDEVEVPSPTEHANQDAPSTLILDDAPIGRWLSDEDHNMPLSPQVQGHRKSRTFTAPRKTISSFQAFQAPFGSPTFHSAEPGPQHHPQQHNRESFVRTTVIDPVGLGVASVMPPPSPQNDDQKRKTVHATDMQFGAQEGRSVGAPSPSNYRAGGMPIRKAKRHTTVLSNKPGQAATVLGGEDHGTIPESIGKLLFCGNSEEPTQPAERLVGPQEEVVLHFVSDVLGVARLPVTQDSKLAALAALLEENEQRAVKGELRATFDLPEGMRSSTLASLARGKVTSRNSPINTMLDNQRRAYQVRGVLAGLVKRLQYLIEYFQATGVGNYSSGGEQKRTSRDNSSKRGSLASNAENQEAEDHFRLSRRRVSSRHHPLSPRPQPLASRRTIVAPGNLAQRRKVSITIDNPPSTAGSAEGHAVWMSTDSTGSASRPPLPHDVETPRASSIKEGSDETAEQDGDSPNESEAGEAADEEKSNEQQQPSLEDPPQVLGENGENLEKMAQTGDFELSSKTPDDVLSVSDMTSPHSGRKSGASTRTTLKFAPNLEVLDPGEGPLEDGLRPPSAEPPKRSLRPSRSRSPLSFQSPQNPGPKQRASVGQLALVNPTGRGEAKPDFEVGGQPLSAHHPELWENMNEDQVRGRLELRKSMSNMRLFDRSPPPEPTGRRSRSLSPAPALPEVKLAGPALEPSPPIQHGSLGHVVRGRAALEASARQDIHEDAGWLLARINAAEAKTAAVASGKHSALGSLSAAVKAASAWKAAATSHKEIIPPFKEIKPADPLPVKRLQEPKRTTQPMVPIVSSTPAQKDAPGEGMRQRSDGWRTSKAYRDLDKERYATAEEVRRQTENVKRRRTKLMKEVESDSAGFKKGRMALDYMWDNAGGEDPLRPSSSASSGDGGSPKVIRELQEQRAREMRDQLHEILMKDKELRPRPRMNLSSWLKKKGIVEEEGTGDDTQENTDDNHHHHRGKLVRTHHQHHGHGDVPDDLELSGHGHPNSSSGGRRLIHNGSTNEDPTRATVAAAQMSAFGKVPAMAALAAAAVAAFREGDDEPRHLPQPVSKTASKGLEPVLPMGERRHESPGSSRSPRLRLGHLGHSGSPTQGNDGEVGAGLGVGGGGSGSPAVRGRPALRDEETRRRQRLQSHRRSPGAELQDSNSDWKHQDLLSAQAQLAALTGHGASEPTKVQLQEIAFKASPLGRIPITRSRSPPRSPPRERRGEKRDNFGGPREFVGLDGFGLMASGYAPGRGQPQRAQSVPGRVLTSTLGQSSFGFFGGQAKLAQSSASPSKSPAPSKTRGRAAPVFTLELDTENLNRPKPIGFRGGQLNRPRKASSLDGRVRARSLDEARGRMQGAKVEPSRSPPRKATVLSVQMPTKQVEGTVEEVHSWLKENLMLFKRTGPADSQSADESNAGPQPQQTGPSPLSMGRFPSTRLGYRGSDWDLRRASKEGDPSAAPRPSRLGVSDAPAPRFGLDTKHLGAAWSTLPKSVKAMGPTNSLDALSSALKNYLEDFSCPSLEAALSPSEAKSTVRNGLAKLEPITQPGLTKLAWGQVQRADRQPDDPSKPAAPAVPPPTWTAGHPPAPPLSARVAPGFAHPYALPEQTPRAPVVNSNGASLQQQEQQSSRQARPPQEQQRGRGGPYPQQLQLDLAGSAILHKQAGTKASSRSPPPGPREAPILISSSSGRLFVPAGQWSKMAMKSSTGSGFLEEPRKGDKELQVVATSPTKLKNAPIVPLLNIPTDSKAAAPKLPYLEAKIDEGNENSASPRRSPSPWHRDKLGQSARMNKDAQKWAKHIEKRLGPDAMGGWRAQVSSAR